MISDQILQLVKQQDEILQQSQEKIKFLQTQNEALKSPEKKQRQRNVNDDFNAHKNALKSGSTGRLFGSLDTPMEKLDFFHLDWCIWSPRSLLVCSCGGRLSWDSWNKPFVVFGCSSPILYQTSRFKCLSCSKTFCSDNDFVIKQCSNEEQSMFPLVRSKETAITKELQQQLLFSVSWGTSMRQFALNIKQSYAFSFYRRYERYASWCMDNGNQPEKIEMDWNAPSADYLQSMLEKALYERKEENDNYMNSISGFDTIAFDHTFFITKCMFEKDEKPFTSLFSGQNEFGEIVSACFVQNETFGVLGNCFEDLAKRTAKENVEIYVDNCCQVRPQLESSFKKAKVKLDLFHFYQRLYRECKDEETKEFLDEVRKVIKNRDDYIPSPETILKELENLEKKNNHLSILQKPVWRETKKHIERNCVSDERNPFVCDKNGKLHSRRGTSKIEAFHSTLRQNLFIRGRPRFGFISALMRFYCYVKNVRSGVLFRNHKETNLIDPLFMRRLLDLGVFSSSVLPLAQTKATATFFCDYVQSVPNVFEKSTPKKEIATVVSGIATIKPPKTELQSNVIQRINKDEQLTLIDILNKCLKERQKQNIFSVRFDWKGKIAKEWTKCVEAENNIDGRNPKNKHLRPFLSTDQLRICFMNREKWADEDVLEKLTAYESLVAKMLKRNR